MRLANLLASDAVLDRAYGWLCEQRRRWPDAADVWSFRRDWPAEKARLQAELRAGSFRFALQERVTRESGEEIDLWSARDALVLKALALVLSDVLPISHRWHCGAVKTALSMSKPGIFFNSGFQPVFDPDECFSCKLCIERCPPEVSDPPLLKLTCREGLK